MEEPDVPWEMEEYWAEDTKDSSMVSWMFHQGLVIGKKILITGMIISSAPVVVPPLIVVSALGFVVSVPYGIILASYACSEKLLDKLLPGTSPPFLLEWEGYSAACKEFYMEEEEEEEEEEKTTDERKEDFNVWTEAEPGGEVTGGFQETTRYFPMTEEGPSSMKIEEVVLTAGAIEPDSRHSETVEEETKGLIIERGAQGTAVDSEPSTDKKSEIGVTDKVEIPSVKKSKRKGRRKEKFHETKPPKDGSDGQAKDDDSNIKTSEELPVHSPIELTLPPKPEMNSDSYPFLNQANDSEEAIWQKIEAVRQIVGYKAARQSTCIDELRSLYLFTGVEPPVSFKDNSSDHLSEVNKKLQFLLSVVGVK